MTAFADPLERLTETIAMAGARGAADIGDALERGRGRIALAVASGASAAAADYFERCRTTLGLGATLVMTPLQFVLSVEDMAGAEVWLFGAGADDPDVAAALECARSSRAEAIRLVTARPDGAAAPAVADDPRSALFVLPVAEPEDDRLPVHALGAMVAALLIASDGITESPRGPELLETLSAGARSAGDDEIERLAGRFRPGDSVLLAHDPQVRPVAALLETSLREAGIAPAQRIELLGFARARRLWAARASEATFALALTTRESEALWRPVEAALPDHMRRGRLVLGHGGRLDNAIGVMRGLALIARLADRAGVDLSGAGFGALPGGDGADRALMDLAHGLTPAVRHKAAARKLHDPPDGSEAPLFATGRDRLSALGRAGFAGLVLDYDGTVVPNEPVEARFGPPCRAVTDELVRLVDGGVRVGFATGRGGSAGDRLRESLPERIHRRILVGYFNGAHVRTLDVDIRRDRPERDPGVAAVAAWIGRSGLLRNADFLVNEVQVTVNRSDVKDVAGFAARLADCPEIAEGKARLLSSHHSFDIVPASASKLVVVRALEGGRGTGLVLAVGDSGSPLGNDRELLSRPHSVSVGSVCGGHDGSWTLFGAAPSGPDALLRLLRAARIGDDGFRIDLARLDLDEVSRP